MQAADRKLLVLAPVLLVLGGLFGALVASLGSSGRSEAAARTATDARIDAPGGAPGDDAALRELSATLGELRETLALMRTTLERRGGGPPAPNGAAGPGSPLAPATRVPVGEEPARDDTELAAALRELARSLRTLRASGSVGGMGGAAAPAALTVPQFVDRAAALERLRLPDGAYDDDDTYERHVLGVKDAHLFWNAQRLLDTYGKPDAIDADDQEAAWTYTRYFGPEPGEAYEAYSFYLHAGLVIEFGIDYGTP